MDEIDLVLNELGNYDGMSAADVADALNADSDVTQVDTIASAALWSAIDWSKVNDADTKALGWLLQAQTLSVKGTGVFERLEAMLGQPAVQTLLTRPISRREQIGFPFPKVGEHHVTSARVRAGLEAPAPRVLNIDLPHAEVDDLISRLPQAAADALRAAGEGVDIKGEAMVRLPLPAIDAAVDSLPANQAAKADEIVKRLVLENGLGFEDTRLTEEAHQAIKDAAAPKADEVNANG